MCQCLDATLLDSRWKRTKAFDDAGNAPICKAFEQVLGTTCESPDQVSCNWTLPSRDKRFIKLQWMPLDWRKYWDLIADINKTGVREDLRANLWSKEEASERREFEEGHRSLHITYVDIDNDGMSEQVVRYDLLPCHKLAWTMFGVMVPATKRLDWRFRYLFLDVNSSDGANIMLYNGITFMYGWQSGWGKLFIWEGSPGTDSRGWRNICQFKHCKGGSKQW